MSQKSVKRPAKGLGAARKKINKENIDPTLLLVNHSNKDRRLILEQQYPLDAEHWVAIGIDPLKSFNVAIRLSSYQRLSGVQLDIDEFEDLFKSQNIIFNSSTADGEPVVLGCCINIQDSKIVKIENNNGKQCMDLCALQQMFKMSNIFHYYINMLKSINFPQFFNDVMSIAFKTQLNIDILSLLDQMTNINGGIKFLGIKEMLIFYPEFVYNGSVDAVTMNVVEDYSVNKTII